MLLFLLEYTMAVLVWTKPEPGEGASPVKRRGVTLAVLTAYPCVECQIHEVSRACRQCRNLGGLAC